MDTPRTTNEAETTPAIPRRHPGRANVPTFVYTQPLGPVSGMVACVAAGAMWWSNRRDYEHDL